MQNALWGICSTLRRELIQHHNAYILYSLCVNSHYRVFLPVGFKNSVTDLWKGITVVAFIQNQPGHTVCVSVKCASCKSFFIYLKKKYLKRNTTLFWYCFTFQMYKKQEKWKYDRWWGKGIRLLQAEPNLDQRQLSRQVKQQSHE